MIKRTCRVVTGLVIEEVPIYSDQEFILSKKSFKPRFIKKIQDGWINTEGTPAVTEAEYVKPHEFCNDAWASSIYLAYTQEVQDILGIPFNVLAEEKKEARKHESHSLRNANSSRAAMRLARSNEEVMELRISAVTKELEITKSRAIFYQLTTISLMTLIAGLEILLLY